MEVWWRFGGGLEEVWRRFGGGLEEVWRRFGGGLEEVWRRFEQQQRLCSTGGTPRSRRRVTRDTIHRTTPRASNKKFAEIRQTLKFLEEFSGIQSLKRKIS